MKRFKAGDAFRGLPTSTWNQFVQASEIVLTGQLDRGGRARGKSGPQATVVYVKNNTESDVGWYGILGIDGPLFSDTDNLNEFQARVMFTASTPAEDTHEGMFVVCIEPIPAGQIGRAVVSGAVQVQVDVKDADHTFAEITDADLTKLTSATSGSARILWKAPGTGTKWAIVRLGDAHVRGRLWANSKERWHNLSADADPAGTILCNPCIDEDGYGVDTDTEITLKLRQIHGKCWNITTERVLSYFIEPANAVGNASVRYICDDDARLDAPLGTIAVRGIQGVDYGIGPIVGATTGWQICDGCDDPQGNPVPDYNMGPEWSRFIKFGHPNLAPIIGSTGGSFSHTHDDHSTALKSRGTEADMSIINDFGHSTENNDPPYVALPICIRVDNSKV